MYFEDNNRVIVLSTEELIGKPALNVYNMFKYLYEVYGKKNNRPVRVFDLDDHIIEPTEQDVVDHIDYAVSFGIINIYIKRLNADIIGQRFLYALTQWNTKYEIYDVDEPEKKLMDFYNGDEKSYTRRRDILYSTAILVRCCVENDVIKLYVKRPPKIKKKKVRSKNT